MKEMNCFLINFTYPKAKLHFLFYFLTSTIHDCACPNSIATSMDIFRMRKCILKLSMARADTRPCTQ